METERLVSRGYTNAEKALARNYMAGDVVGFHRPYKRLGVEKGDELRVAGVDKVSRDRDCSQKKMGRTVDLATGPGRGPGGRRRGLQEGDDGASGRRPHPLDPQRCRARAREQPERRGDGGQGRSGELPASWTGACST